MTELPFLMLDERKAAALPLYRQIYESIRRAILSGRLAPGSRLPASRALAGQLSVSRLTVVNAFEQLLAEGYLEGRTGAGTFVASKIPEDLLQISGIESEGGETRRTEREVRVSGFAARLIADSGKISPFQSSREPVPFKNGLTAVSEFPFGIWEKLTVRACRKARFQMQGYGEPAGYAPLREAVAAHLAASRGVRCATEQVFITNGAQQALDLIGRVLLEAGDRVWLEDPCYREAEKVFRSNGAEIVPVPVDAEGFDAAAAEKRSGPAELVYVTPSHQYPTGVTMSLGRRLNLLEWARKNRSWIVEDDYNSEFRYAGRPLASLHNLDRDGRVIYVGTFSKTIFPALRLGCLVVPKNLIEVFAAARGLCDNHSPLFEQMTLALFIAEGHFARHLRRMRALYEKRQHFLIEEAARHLSGHLKLSKAASGMHLIGWLREAADEIEVCRRAAEIGLNLSPLSSYCLETKLPPGLVLGYTGFDERQTSEAVRRLKAVFESFGH